MYNNTIIPERRPIEFIPVPLNENEIFVPINEEYYKGIKPFYLISSFGRVFNKYTGKFLSVYVGGRVENSRFVTSLQFEVNGVKKDRRVFIQRCMMISFNFNPDCDKLEVDHVDGVWYNNYLSNLEWVTKQENMKRARDIGLISNPINEIRKRSDPKCPIIFTL